MLCVWLLPSEEQSELIANIISSNMSSLKRPVFTPHMTLFDSNNALDSKLQNDFLKAVDLINKQWFQPLKLKVINSCVYGHKFYKSFYCEIDHTKALQAICDKIKQLDKASTYKLSPHLSLAYGNDNHKLQTITFEEIIFDKICLVADNNEESNAAISAWKIIKSRKLGRG